MIMTFAMARLQTWLAFLLPLFAAGPLSNVRAASTDTILDAAKREGEIVFYASMNLAEANIMITEFEKRYPPIKVKLNRAGSEKLLTRVLANAAKVFIDFVLSHEGQRLQQGFGRLVARTDLVSDQPAAIRQIKMVPVNPELAEKMNDYAKQLRTIFGG